MRLAGHTYAFRDEPLEAALELVAAAGFDRAELWVGHASAGPAAVVRAVGRSGLGIAAVGVGGFYDDDPLPVAAAFRLAAALGAPAVVACVAPAVLPGLARRVPAGLALHVENHWDQPLARPREVLRALAAAETGAPLAAGAALGACLDTGHALHAGVDPLRFAALLGPRLGHVHLKDARRTPAGQLALGRRLRRRLLPRPSAVLPGEGHLDVTAFLGALRAVGFAGTVACEHEGDDAAVALALLRTVALPAVAARPAAG